MSFYVFLLKDFEGYNKGSIVEVEDAEQKDFLIQEGIAKEMFFVKVLKDFKTDKGKKYYKGGVHLMISSVVEKLLLRGLVLKLDERIDSLCFYRKKSCQAIDNSGSCVFIKKDMQQYCGGPYFVNKETKEIKSMLSGKEIFMRKRG